LVIFSGFRDHFDNRVAARRIARGEGVWHFDPSERLISSAGRGRILPRVSLEFPLDYPRVVAPPTNDRNIGFLDGSLSQSRSPKGRSVLGAGNKEDP
jgi:hypothetical protein